MKTALTLALFAAATCSLAAQRYEPAYAKPVVAVPQEPPVDPLPPLEPQPTSLWTAALRLGREGALRLVRDGALFAELSTSRKDATFVGFLLADVEPGVVQLPQLPPLLKTDFVVATAIGTGSTTFDLGPATFGFDVYVQGVAWNGIELASTSVERIAARGIASL